MLDLYKLAVEMADRVSARRGAANTFFLSVQGAVVAALGFLSSQSPEPAKRYLIAMCVVGVAASLVWFLLLRSYRDLNRAKFEVILRLEHDLPVALFADEWSSLKKDPIARWRGRYAELGSVERLGPALFGAIDLVLASFILFS
ncbi:RipA family octameric membrane protein [Nocardioides cavernaquae]|uniref:RipA family octameric membrane protein n=1 Tax=Nocardioides cavernaquae TaxID=2321396 RepID=UPI001C7D3E2F|nr:hypothetical protein [Nocardioides cavernaquae]